MPAERGPAGCERCGGELAADALFCPRCGAPRARADGDPLIGEIVADRYLLQRRLGHGGSGTIYLAEHVTLRRKVAVKIIHHELSRDDLAVERFRREATTVGEIDNDHIVEVYDFGRAPDGRLFLAMEYLEGETLADALARLGRLPVAGAVDTLVQLGEALMEAHAMGYVHRDLRPRNVFLITRRGQANFLKLLDFGLAKLVEKEGEAAATSLGMTFGDPRYMSPEQARGEPFDRRADIYSLGVMAWEMLVGSPPFAGTKVFDVLTAHLEESPAPPSSRSPGVPAWLDAVVLRAMAKSPDDRFTTVYRLVEALQQGRASGAIMSDDAARSMPAVVPPPPAPRSREGAAVAPPPEGRAPGVGVPEVGDRGAPPTGGTPTGGAPTASASEVPRWRASGPEQAAGVSATWFSDGEAGAPGTTAETLARRSDGDGSEDEDFDDARPPRRRGLWIGAAVAGAALSLVLLVALWPRSSPRPAAAPDAARDRQSAAPDAAPAATPPPDAPFAVPDAAPAAVAAGRLDAGAKGPRVPGREPGWPPPPIVIGPPGAPDAAPEPGPGPGDPTPGSDSQATQAEFFVKLGQEALSEGDAVAAAGHFNRARELDRRNVEAIAGFGQVAMKLNRIDEAIVHLEEASRLAPRSARIHVLRGEAYLAAGKHRQAAAAFKAALKLQPDNAAARRGLDEASAGGGE